MAGIFPPANVGVGPGPNACNSYTPSHQVIGEGPVYVSSRCTTPLSDCMYNALISEILAAVDLLGFPFHADRVDNLGQAIKDRIEQIDLGRYVVRAGDWMQGPLHLFRDPVVDSEAANKRYVDAMDDQHVAEAVMQMTDALHNVRDILQANIDGKVSRSGDQMTGPLILHADPITDHQAATKRYVDQHAGNVVISAEAPPLVHGRFWWDNTSGDSFIGYDDGSSIQWVQFAPGIGVDGGGNGFDNPPNDAIYGRIGDEWTPTVTLEQPEIPTPGRLWFDDGAWLLGVWTGGEWAPFGYGITAEWNDPDVVIRAYSWRSETWSPMVYVTPFVHNNPLDWRLSIAHTWLNPDDDSLRIRDQTVWREIGYLKLTGGTVSAPFVLSGLPTSDPAVVDAIWNDGGTLKISAG